MNILMKRTLEQTGSEWDQMVSFYDFPLGSQMSFRTEDFRIVPISWVHVYRVYVGRYYAALFK